jgi:hypothetical protein
MPLLGNYRNFGSRDEVRRIDFPGQSSSLPHFKAACNGINAKSWAIQDFFCEKAFFDSR